MADEKSTGKSTEEQMQKIDAIVGSEALGYEGGAREEHSGATKPAKDSSNPKDGLADNKPADLG